MDCVVVGAGVVGLAVARALALAGREVLVMERHGAIGHETSSRNSEVVHAGIYYPEGSLKARTCVEGRRRLYAHCAERGVPHRRTGKLIVGFEPAHDARLDALMETGRRNGVEGLERVTAAEARALEPALDCRGAIHSPETGIVDSHGLMVSLQGDLESAGGLVAFETAVDRVERNGHGLVLRGVSAGEPMTLGCALLVNAAGLSAPDLARRVEGLDPAHAPEARYAKGRYCSVTGRAPFERLIYPIPVDGGLGVHLTLDLAGRPRLGPDVEWVDGPDDLAVPDDVVEAFHASALRWWPDLARDRLAPDYAGIRPKLVGPGEPAADFRVEGPEIHGVPGLVNLFGIESPGLTASLALADHVVRVSRDAV